MKRTTSLKLAATTARAVALLFAALTVATGTGLAQKLAQQAYLKPHSLSVADDRFGISVAIDGDTAVIGAYGKNGNTGAADVYVRTAGVWTHQQVLTAFNSGAGDLFGRSVAISGDTIVVGADQEASSSAGVGNGFGSPLNPSNNSAPAAGAAYVFVRSGSTWSSQAYLKASNAQSGDQFGVSVAISGDTVVVGARSENSNGSGQVDNSSTNAGAAYVFVRSGVVWSQQAYVKSPNPGTGDYFGDLVAVSGDTLAVAAPSEDGNQTDPQVGGPYNDSAADSGAVYVYKRSAGTWSLESYVKAPNTGAGDTFGSAVALSGDTLVVGAELEDSNATGVGGTQADNSSANSGAAYVFTRTGVTWSTQAYLKASNTGANDNFGHAVAVVGDTVVVGAYLEDSSATGVDADLAAQLDNTGNRSGSAYVFTRNAGNWAQTSYLKASNTGALDDFGNAVGVSGNTILVGAYLEDSNATGVDGDQSNNAATNSGSAYIFIPGATINSSPTGRSFTSTGTGCAPGAYTTPKVLPWAAGSSCSVAFPTPQTVGTTEYRFSQWEDASTFATRSITATGTDTTYTATFDTYYQLTTAAGLGGTVSAGGFVLAGTNTNVTATPAGGFAFTNFTGAVTSTSNPLSLLMDAPKSVTANFASSGAPLLTASIASKANGGLANERIWTLQVTNSGAGGCTNVRVASVQILAANPSGNLGLISLGSTVYPAAVANPALSPGQSSTVPISIIFPVTSPATRIQFRINLAGDNG